MESNQELLQKAQHIWNMLDELVDSDPQSYDKFIKGQMSEGRQMFATPRPYMCVVTDLLHPRKEKLYVNITSWVRVPKPKTREDPIPVIADSMERRKQGKEKMSLINCAFNLSVLVECCETEEKKEMLVNLALDFVEQNCEARVSREYEILPDRKFKGNPQSLRFAFQKKPPPEEAAANVLKDPDSLLRQFGKMTADETVDPAGKTDSVRFPTESTPKNPGLIEEISSSDGRLERPKHELSVKEASDKHPRRLVAKISLPGVESVQECILDISEDDLTLEVPSKYQLQLQLQVLVVEDQVSAKFSKKSSSLTVTMPTKQQS